MPERIWPAALIACALLAPAAQAQQTRTTLDGVTLSAKVVATGFDAPVFLTSPPGDDRMFVVEQSGRIMILQKGRTLPQPFLDLSGQIATGSERGLLGLAFHPSFATNGRFFVYFTDVTGDVRIAELRVAPTGNVVDPSTLRPILTINHRRWSNHNGGWLTFGPDGNLYIGVGDGGGSGDKSGNSQNPQRLLGKILRINVDGAEPYSIPATNPYAKGGGQPEIFATGLRNPWRAAFDGDRLYIADVGQNKWEEVNVVKTTPGLNFGWNRMEGATCFATTPCAAPDLTQPVVTYSHDDGCSVTGGFVYRGTAMPALTGRYLFSDFCSGVLMSLRMPDATVTTSTDLGNLGQVTSFGQDSKGEVYILNYDGVIRKLVPAN